MVFTYRGHCQFIHELERFSDLAVGVVSGLWGFAVCGMMRRVWCRGVWVVAVGKWYQCVGLELMKVLRVIYGLLLGW